MAPRGVSTSRQKESTRMTDVLCLFSRDISEYCTQKSLPLESFQKNKSIVDVSVRTFLVSAPATAKTPQLCPDWTPPKHGRLRQIVYFQTPRESNRRPRPDSARNAVGLFTLVCTDSPAPNQVTRCSSENMLKKHIALLCVT